MKKETSEPLALMIEAFIEQCEPEFEWEISQPYIYGDHPDYGGGVIQRDIESVELVGSMGLNRKQCVALFGEFFIEKVESHVFENSDTYQ